MLSAVVEFLERYNLDAEGKTYAVGFSGGYDSMCLLDILNKLSKTYGFSLIALHLNHNWRGEEAKKEAENCKNFCEKNEIKFVTETLDKNLKKTETTARLERQKFFKKNYEKYNVDGLFLAHNKSDNTETLLYRVIKGTGVNGLCGIAPKNTLNGCEIYRPILAFARDEIEAYISENNLSPNVDSSNADSKYMRNFIRHKILPQIKEINSNVDEAVKKLSQIASSEQKIINEYLEILRKKITFEGRIRTEKFLALSEDVQKKFILNFLLERGLEYDSKRIYEIFGFIKENAESKTGKTYSLNSDSWLFVSKKELYPFQKTKDENVQEAITVYGCGEVCFGGSVFRVKKYVGDTPLKFPLENENAAFVSGLEFPLTLRFRQDGDVIQPFGMSGSMKLKKFFINKNMPKNMRDSVILLCKNKEVLWASGCCVSEKLRAGKMPDYVLTIEEKNEGGCGCDG